MNSVVITPDADYDSDFRPRHAHRARVSWRWVIVLVAAAALWWLFKVVSDPRFMPVTTIRVEGVLKHLPQAQLRADIAAVAAGGFFSVDVDDVQRAAQHSAWIASASVRRLWPDALQVTVTEHKPIARWGESALLSERGVVFVPPLDSFPPGLPLLIGPPGQAVTVAQRWAMINQALLPLRQSAQRVTLDERRAWTVLLNNGVELLLGREGREDMDLRMRRYVDAYAVALAAHVTRIAALDLRYTNGFAVRWIQPTIP